MLPRVRLITALAALAAAQPCHTGDQLPGRVLRVIDGDSLVLDVRGGHFRVELAGIDAPELNQAWGEAAASYLYRTLTGAFVVVDRVRFDASGAAHGTIITRGRDLAEGLLHQGLAWSVAAPRASDADSDHSYAVAEQQARKARRGLWSDEHPVPPWEWRGEPAPGDQSRSMR